jgi:hypothetical protein
MLKELIAKRDEELNQVNQHPKENRAQLKALGESIKSKHLVFAKGLASIFESILVRSKLSSPFKFAQLAKYLKFFITNEETIPIINDRLELISQILHLHMPMPDIAYLCRYHYFYSELTSQLILICSPINIIFDPMFGAETKMGVLNKSGEIIHFKELSRDLSKEYDFKANATNIIAQNRTDAIIEIYNFKLELVHSIKLDWCYTYWKLNNYEIAFAENDIDDYSEYFPEYYQDNVQSDNLHKLTIICYNYQTVHVEKNVIEIRLDENGFEQFDESVFLFHDLNDKFLFITGSLEAKSKYATILCLMNREDGNKLYKYFKFDLALMPSWHIYNTEICCHFRQAEADQKSPPGDDEVVADLDRNMVSVYDINSSLSNSKGEYQMLEDRRPFWRACASSYKHIYSTDLTESGLKLKYY